MTADPRPDMPDSDAPAPARSPAARGNLRERRARLIRGEQADAPPPADNPERAGPRLTAQQRTAVIATIATYWHVDTVQRVLREEHEDIPELSDRLIRYYRARIEAGALKAADQARDRALASGLALKSTRVAHLSRMHNQLATVPIVEREPVRTEEGAIVEGRITTIRLDVARERRELLNQIAREMGLESKASPLPPGPNPPGSPPPPAEGIEGDVARVELAGLLTAMQQRRAEVAAAAEAAERAAEQARQRAAAGSEAQR